MCRPREAWHVVEPKLRQELLAFMHASPRTPRTIEVTERLSIDLFRAGCPYDSFFLLGAGSDHDSGGFVLAEVHRNLALCIAEKERKVAPFRKRYAEWWLVLPDHIGYALDSDDQKQFRLLPMIEHSWAKVILVNPYNPAHAFEV